MPRVEAVRVLRRTGVVRGGSEGSHRVGIGRGFGCFHAGLLRFSARDGKGGVLGVLRRGVCPEVSTGGGGDRGADESEEEEGGKGESDEGEEPTAQGGRDS
jgi:hypothetical protein